MCFNAGQEATLSDKNGETTLQLDAAVITSAFKHRFEIQRLIGKGGMAVVYKARDLVLNRTVAIKILRSMRMMDRNAIVRFQREAQAASRLDHPNVIKVLEFGVIAETEPYLILEYADGQNLAEMIKKREFFSVERMIDLSSQICSALQHAHSQKVLHRDIKPHNIVVVVNDLGEEQIKLLDFGMAKVLEAGTSVTDTGEIFGSPLYMSPEQCIGQRLDARSDIYSLGCCMYEMLAYTPPFIGSSAMHTMQMHMKEQPFSLREYRKDVSEGLEEVILRCLAKDPKDRFQTAEELARSLRSRKTVSTINAQALSRFRFRKIKKGSHLILFLLLALLAVGAHDLWSTWLEHKTQALRSAPPGPSEAKKDEDASARITSLVENGRLLEAEELARSTYSALLADKQMPPVIKGEGYQACGACYHANYMYSESAISYRHAAEEFQRAGQLERAAYCYLAAADDVSWKDYPHLSRAWNDIAVRAEIKLHGVDSLEMEPVFQRCAQTCWQSGDYARCIEYAQLALKIIDRNPNKLPVISSYWVMSYLGGAHQNLAQQAYENSLNSRNPARERAVFRKKSIEHLALALSNLRQAISIGRANGVPPGLIEVCDKAEARAVTLQNEMIGGDKR